MVNLPLASSRFAIFVICVFKSWPLRCVSAPTGTAIARWIFIATSLSPSSTGCNSFSHRVSHFKISASILDLLVRLANRGSVRLPPVGNGSTWVIKMAHPRYVLILKKIQNNLKFSKKNWNFQKILKFSKNLKFSIKLPNFKIFSR